MVNEYGSKAVEAFRAGQESVADTLDDAASRLEETARAGDSASGRIHHVADRVKSAAGHVRDYDVKDMADAMKTFVNAHPVSAIVGAAVLGFLAGRAARS